jgi:glycosyltransferase involved in cell wall biosynthesis
MRVLTFGWDHPPIRNGGLGVACYGLTRELVDSGVDVIFVLPRSQPTQGPARFVFADAERNVRVYEVPSAIQPYQGSRSVQTMFDEFGTRVVAQHTMVEAVQRFAARAKAIAQNESFEIIHAHDWTSYLAGVAAKRVSGKPLVLHVHATTYDQAASDNIDPVIYDIEHRSFSHADKVVTVSQFTKDILTTKHHVPADKIDVVHNGCDTYEPPRHRPTLQEWRAQGKRVILYHGRITIQKGVDYFVQAARRVVDEDPDVIFVISGWGDMMNQIVAQVGAMGLSSHVLFAGALWEEERDRMYQSVDLVVMPSVSEPFGLVPLEAMQHGTPSLISKQSGVSEIMAHVLKVDFWDVEEMANKILATLRYGAMHRQMVREGKQELPRFSWRYAAEKVVRLYHSLRNLITS